MDKVYLVIEETGDYKIVGAYSDAVKADDLALFLQERGLNNIVIEVHEVDTLPPISALKDKIRLRRDKASYIIEWNMNGRDYQNDV